MHIVLSEDLSAVDWRELNATLAADNFDNGRSDSQLQQSFENSFAVCFALAEGRVIGKARALSDDVCNAYVVDVWTLSAYRRQGIAGRMMKRLLERLRGQHVYLFTDTAIEFYKHLGFEEQPAGMGMVAGTWLDSPIVNKKRR